MSYDARFALIDTDGEERFAAIIDGTFQVGKAKVDDPTDLEKFVKAILKEGKEGRFVSADGIKHGTLKFSKGAREAQAYRLDPVIASKLGIPAYGTR